jgi:hypothetical protein
MGISRANSPVPRRVGAYGGRAYRSEIALFRAQGVTAAEADQVAAPADVTRLWRVEMEDETD